MIGLSGSYDPRDVTFLLKEIALAPTVVEEKERLLQSGKRHYSEMIGAESPPDEEYLSLYREALQRNSGRLAVDIARLARAISVSRPDGVTLLSLARAGTPIGVLLRRALVRLGNSVSHYSISIVRGRGIDTRALDHVRAHHEPSTWVFVDGWTGKGAITCELRSSMQRYATDRALPGPSTLAVISDLAGLADHAATDEDYLIPSAILNAVVSGLVSRTILPRDHDAAMDFHRCVFYSELQTHDLSREFVDALSPLVDQALTNDLEPLARERSATRTTSAAFLRDTMARWRVSDPNRVKPGIGEATRALLRRVPQRLLLRESGGADVLHLELLAARKGVPIEIDAAMPYRATVLIRSLGADA